MNEKVCPQCGTEYPREQRFCPTDGSALRSSHGTTDLVGTVVADRYLILETLGQGGMGRVYLAEHVRMGRKCALKVMNPKMASDPDAISRFNREAANACKISHPHVAAVYDFGETSDGLIYLAMEYVDGVPLTKLVEQLGTLPPQRASSIARQTSDALAAAHELGIVHRDLKPDNIMITQNRDGSDCVKVVDFGIAKVADSDAQKVTKTGYIVGTPEYMSPEQLSGDKIDARSDVYSLALVSFNMLTGKLPFPAGSQQEAMIMRLTDKPKRLAEMAPSVAWPAELQQVLDKALSRDVRARFQHAADFGRAFGDCIDSKAIAADTEIMRSQGAPSAVRAVTRQLEAPDAPMQQQVPATMAAPAGIKQSHPAFKSRAIAAILLLGVGGIGAAAMVMRSRGEGRNAASSTDSVLYSKAMDSTRGSSGTSSAAAVTTIEDRLQRLENLTDPDRGADSITAAQALTALEAMEDSVGSGRNRFHARLLRAEALMLVKREKAGCQVLRDLQATRSDDPRMKRVNVLVSTCSVAS
jgi:tRNA A-37 threonylcarbamoyl transferase component Bud32